MLSVVFETDANPSMQRQPSQKAEDIGARLYDPFAFVVLISTTGVPR
jgi:hypothetical protein